MNHKITIYGAEWCPYCHDVQDYLTKKMIDFEYIDIEIDPAAKQQLDNELGAEQYYFPVIKIGDKTLQGFNKRKINAALKP